LRAGMPAESELRCWIEGAPQISPDCHIDGGGSGEFANGEHDRLSRNLFALRHVSRIDPC